MCFIILIIFINVLVDDGISIPSSYTSYIAPVQSSRLYNEVRGCREKDKHHLAHFEMPYVVHLQNKYDIDQPQALFTFHHPNRGLIYIHIGINNYYHK